MDRSLPRFIARCALLTACLLAATTSFAATIPSPSEYLHLDIGADRVLADYRQIRSYFAELDRLSPRVQMQTLGKSTLGEDMVMAVITSEANMARLPRLKEIAAKLADPRGLTDAQIAALTEEGRAVLLITCNIHATEIGSTQMAMEWAHALASAEDTETKRRLDEVVLLLVPSLNPDGQIMETEWYRKYLGTPYEGGREPWLYHHYTGHDNNRDWFMLTQSETKAMSRAVYREWFPQVWLDEHQMGNTGPRIFTPPYAEPVDADIHPLVWREVNRMGADMSLRLEQANKSGVIYGYAFDAYWPGGTKNTAWFKNISGLLTEVASVKLATPVYVDPSELSGGGRKGLVEYEPQTNFPNPWPGGWWRLRDIMDYERIASDAILESSADLRRDLLRNVAVRARASIALGAHGEGFLVPRARQHDWAAALKLADLLVEHGVEVYLTEDDDLWVPLAQPYGNFVREMLTTQRYPEVKLVPGKDIVRPYDVAAWSLPLMMGVTVEAAAHGDADERYLPVARGPATTTGAAVLPPNGAERAKGLNAALRSGGRVVVIDHATESGGRTWAAGTAFLDAKAAAAAEQSLPSGIVLEHASAPSGRALTAPRVALYKPWAASMDEGWTRFLLERYGFAPRTLDNAAIQKGNLRASFDAIVLPDVPKEVIATGKQKREDGGGYFVELPPEYRGGLDAAGAAALRAFVQAGGTLIALSGSCEYVTEQFNIPVSNALGKVTAADFGCPGSILRAHVNAEHPVTWGMPAEAALFVDKPIAFATQPPAGELDRAVLATYPDDPRDVLLSGWIMGEDRLVRRSAAVAVTMGKGKIVLFGFRPQHRAQTDGTHPLLFNALWWSSLGD